MDIEDIRNKLDCCVYGPESLQKAMIALMLGQIDAINDLSEILTPTPVQHTITTGTAMTIPAGAYAYTVQVMSGTVVMDGLTFKAGQFYSSTADFRRTLPELTITGSGTVSWKRIE